MLQVSMHKVQGRFCLSRVVCPQYPSALLIHALLVEYTEQTEWYADLVVAGVACRS